MSESPSTSSSSVPGGLFNSSTPPSAFALGLLFGAFYFVQGINEPNEGLIAQPVRSLLKNWGQDAAQISTFFAWMLLPWSFKPIYGLISDFIPLAGLHRRSYLMVTTSVTSLCLLSLYLLDLPPGSVETLFLLLILPTIGIAFSDVLVDALMVQTAQPLGLTGRLQSIQWTAIYAAGILGKPIGGLLSQYNQQNLGFLIGAAATFGTLLLVVLVAREPRRGFSHETFAETWR